MYRIILMITAVILSAAGALYPTDGDSTISYYATDIADQEQNVKSNIALASMKLNGITIQPGEIFSFNRTVGEGSAANGYLNGRVLYQDMTSYEPGGGICQVSSTLFNALLLSGCSIVERHRHARPVRYVPSGLDATIRYGKKDLRMKNTTGNPLKIFTSINEKNLKITVKGVNSGNYIYEIYTDEESITLPFNKSEGKVVKNGISIYVYRKKISDGRITENLLLYKDFYPPYYVDNVKSADQ